MYVLLIMIENTGSARGCVGVYIKFVKQKIWITIYTYFSTCLDFVKDVLSFEQSSQPWLPGKGMGGT